MQSLGERVAHLIKTLSITKTKFAERLNVSTAFISQICSGASQPSDRTISDICREFNVSETWLRTGEGEMFPPMDALDELALLSGRFLSSSPTEFQQRFARMMYSLTPEEWKLLEKKARALLEED